MWGKMPRKVPRNGFSWLSPKSCYETSQAGFQILRSDWLPSYRLQLIGGISLSVSTNLKTSYSKGDSAQLKNSMLKLINDRQVMHRSELDLLEKIFNFQFESKELIHAVKESDILARPRPPSPASKLVGARRTRMGNYPWNKEQLLLGNFQWSAKLKITIVEAIGLLPKDNNGSSDPYCLVQGELKLK